jgi:glycosyltransferase involved in cell wall biosynthesis
LPVLERIEHAVLSRAQKVLAQSQHTADVLVRDGISAHRIEVRPVPVDTDLYAPGDEERSGVLFVGRARDPRKAFHRLAEALSASASLRDVGVDVISSQSPVAPEEAKRAIRWHGHVEDLPLRYRSAEVLALSSVQEGLGIVVFEALASGTPVVAMRCGGPDAFIQASGGGFVVDDQRGFADKLELLVKDQALAKEMGSAGRAYVLENMSGASFLNDPTIFRL